MKKFLFLPGTLLAFMLFSAKTCDSPEEKERKTGEAVMIKVLDSIKSELVSEELSGTSLRAFEEKAKQKLIDFSDYLRIYSDTSLEESFKDLAGRMILDLFISGDVSIKIRVPEETGEKNLTLTELLNKDIISMYHPIDITPDSIEISEPLHRINTGNYAGSLKFTRKHSGAFTGDHMSGNSGGRHVMIIASKVKKPFGSDTLQLWKIFLGDIR